MRKLESYVNDKLRVTKDIYVPDLIALLKSKDIKEFNSRCEQLSEYLKNDSDLPIAELEYLKGGPKKLSKNMKTPMIHFCGLKKTSIFFMVRGTPHILCGGLELIMLLNVIMPVHMDSRDSHFMIKSYLNPKEYIS